MKTGSRLLITAFSLAGLAATPAPARNLHREPYLQSVFFRGVGDPDGKQLPDQALVECRVYDPNKAEETRTIAHSIGVAGAGEFEVSILNNQYTQSSLKGCRCSIEMHGKGENNWDVSPYLTFKFYDGSIASVRFGKIKLGNGEGFKPKFDLAIPTL